MSYIIAIGETRGKLTVTTAPVRNMYHKNISIADITEIVDLNIDKVKAIITTAITTTNN